MHLHLIPYFQILAYLVELSNQSLHTPFQFDVIFGNVAKTEGTDKSPRLDVIQCKVLHEHMHIRKDVCPEHLSILTDPKLASKRNDYKKLIIEI